jgi:hypothetical protein
MDSLSLRILLLAGTGRLLEAKAAGHAMLAAGRGLHLRCGRGRPREPGRVAAFEAGPDAAPLDLPLGNGQAGVTRQPGLMQPVMALLPPVGRPAAREG